MAGGNRLREMELKKFREISKPGDYSSLAGRKQMIELKFKSAARAYTLTGRKDIWIEEEKRKTQLLKMMDRAKTDFSSLRVRCFEEALTDFEITCATNFDWLQEDYNYILGAAIWVLDELRKNGRLADAYKFLPSSRMDIEEVYTPLDFYHPCYEDDLIQSVAWVLDPKNSTGDGYFNFTSLLNLIEEAHIGRATLNFKDLWKVIGLYLQCVEFYDRKFQRMIQTADNLFQSNVMMARPISEEERMMRLRETAEELQETQLEATEFNTQFEHYLGTGERRIMDHRELGKIMNDFRVENPFEICFGLVCMMGLRFEEIWSMKTAAAVITVAGRMLPWYQPGGGQGSGQI